MAGVAEKSCPLPSAVHACTGLQWRDMLTPEEGGGCRMPRQRYQLTDGDFAVVQRWVRERFRNVCSAPPGVSRDGMHPPILDRANRWSLSREGTSCHG